MYLVLKINTKYSEKFEIHKEKKNNSVKDRDRYSWRFQHPLSVTDGKSRTKKINEVTEDLSNTIHKLNWNLLNKVGDTFPF